MYRRQTKSLRSLGLALCCSFALVGTGCGLPEIPGQGSDSSSDSGSDEPDDGSEDTTTTTTGEDAPGTTTGDDATTTGDDTTTTTGDDATTTTGDDATTTTGDDATTTTGDDATTTTGDDTTTTGDATTTTGDDGTTTTTTTTGDDDTTDDGTTTTTGGDDDTTDDSPESPDESEDTPETKKKASGKKCDSGDECESGLCRKISLKYLTFDWSTKTCAECSDHDECRDSDRGLGCNPQVESIKKRNSSFYGCSEGKLGDVCEKSSHCAGDWVCGTPQHGIPLLPKFPIKTCSECRTDKDCKDEDRPKCKLNRSVDALKLPAYNICAKK